MSTDAKRGPGRPRKADPATPVTAAEFRAMTRVDAPDHDPAPPAVAAEYEIPAGLRESAFDFESPRTMNPWATDRIVGYFGAHTVEVVDGLCTAPNGRTLMASRVGDKLTLTEL